MQLRESFSWMLIAVLISDCAAGENKSDNLILLYINVTDNAHQKIVAKCP